MKSATEKDIKERRNAYTEKYEYSILRFKEEGTKFDNLVVELSKAGTGLTLAIMGYSTVKGSSLGGSLQISLVLFFFALIMATSSGYLAKLSHRSQAKFLEKGIICYDTILQNRAEPTPDQFYPSPEVYHKSEKKRRAFLIANETISIGSFLSSIIAAVFLGKSLW